MHNFLDVYLHIDSVFEEVDLKTEKIKSMGFSKKALFIVFAISLLKPL